MDDTNGLAMCQENLPDDVDVVEPMELIPCRICNRKFVHESVAKHEKICQKFTVQKRKPFNSLAQRVAGTDLANFHLPVYHKPTIEITKSSPDVKRKTSNPSSSRTTPIRDFLPKHPVVKSNPRVPAHKLTQETSRCPTCGRSFGTRAYDRHVEWCKESKALQNKSSPANVVAAKERFEARKKYRAPIMANKAQREINKIKYSPHHKSDELEQMIINDFQRSCDLVVSPYAKNFQASPANAKQKPKKSSTFIKSNDKNARENCKHVENEQRNMCNYRSPSSACGDFERIPNLNHLSSTYNPFSLAEQQLKELLISTQSDHQNLKSISPKLTRSDSSDTNKSNKSDALPHLFVAKKYPQSNVLQEKLSNTFTLPTIDKNKGKKPRNFIEKNKKLMKNNGTVKNIANVQINITGIPNRNLNGLNSPLCQSPTDHARKVFNIDDIPVKGVLVYTEDSNEKDTRSVINYDDIPIKTIYSNRKIEIGDSQVDLGKSNGDDNVEELERIEEVIETDINHVNDKNNKRKISAGDTSRKRDNKRIVDENENIRDDDRIDGNDLDNVDLRETCENGNYFRNDKYTDESNANEDENRDEDDIKTKQTFQQLKPRLSGIDDIKNNPIFNDQTSENDREKCLKTINISPFASDDDDGDVNDNLKRLEILPNSNGYYQISKTALLNTFLSDPFKNNNDKPMKKRFFPDLNQSKADNMSSSNKSLSNSDDSDRFTYDKEPEIEAKYVNREDNLPLPDFFTLINNDDDQYSVEYEKEMSASEMHESDRSSYIEADCGVGGNVKTNGDDFDLDDFLQSFPFARKAKRRIVRAEDLLNEEKITNIGDTFGAFGANNSKETSPIHNLLSKQENYIDSYQPGLFRSDGDCRRGKLSDPYLTYKVEKSDGKCGKLRNGGEAVNRRELSKELNVVAQDIPNNGYSREKDKSRTYNKYEDKYKEEFTRTHKLNGSGDAKTLDSTESSDVSKNSTIKLRKKTQMIHQSMLESVASAQTYNQTGSSAIGAAKFCYQCGTAFATSTAKFCVECGSKRVNNEAFNHAHNGTHNDISI